jgi:hypothetical protein
VADVVFLFVEFTVFLKLYLKSKVFSSI